MKRVALHGDRSAVPCVLLYHGTLRRDFVGPKANTYLYRAVATLVFSELGGASHRVIYFGHSLYGEYRFRLTSKMSHDLRRRGSCSISIWVQLLHFDYPDGSTRRDGEGRWLWRLVRPVFHRLSG